VLIHALKQTLDRRLIDRAEGLALDMDGATVSTSGTA
jgi:hypothetical protein